MTYMGKEIVRQESPKPEERSRLWLVEDVCEVFEKNTGTSKVKGIMIPNKYFPKRIRLTGESFKEMNNLQILIVCNNIFDGGPVDYLSNELTVLDWRCCPLLSFPSEFDPQKLVIFNMRMSRTLFQGDQLKTMQHLKSLDLGFCQGLRRIPDLSGLTNLVEMNLRGCRNLVEVHNSVGGLGKLVNFDLGGCLKLRMFPTTINLKSLVNLNLSDCSLEFFPEIEREMKSLKSLCLSRTAIQQLPSSVGYLNSLEKLELDYCGNLTYLPWTIFETLQHLQFVDLQNCPELVTFPAESESLPPWLYSTNSASLCVNLSNCKKLQEISEFPREIDCLIVRGCVSLERISTLSKILEGKESKMMRCMDWSNCQRLCDNLVQDVANLKTKMSLSSSSLDNLGQLYCRDKMRQFGPIWTRRRKHIAAANKKLKALLSLFLSCRESEFQVVFPASAPVPNWFTCRKDMAEWNSAQINGYEFCIEIPQCFNWEKKGLALCATSWWGDESFFQYLKVYINDVCIYHYKEGDQGALCDLDEGHMWVYYIPFINLIKILDLSGYMCRIKFENIDALSSWGAHVLMAKDDEEASIEIVVHQDKNKRCYVLRDWEEDSDDQDMEDNEGLDYEYDYDSEDNEDHPQEPTNFMWEKFIGLFCFCVN